MCLLFQCQDRWEVPGSVAPPGAAAECRGRGERATVTHPGRGSQSRRLQELIQWWQDEPCARPGVDCGNYFSFFFSLSGVPDAAGWWGRNVWSTFPDANNKVAVAMPPLPRCLPPLCLASVTQVGQKCYKENTAMIYGHTMRREQKHIMRRVSESELPGRRRSNDWRQDGSTRGHGHLWIKIPMKSDGHSNEPRC